MPDSPSLRTATIWLSVNRDFFKGVARKVKLNHLVQSKTEPFFRKVSPFCAGADDASEGTVDVDLSAEDIYRYKARQARSTKLGPFHNYIRERVHAALPDRIAGPALLRELRAQGYTGELRSLQAFMQLVSLPVASDPVVRFETAPVQQMQCDFVVFRRGANPLYAFTVTLGFSRWRWVRFTSNERADTLFSCHHALFETLGGVPREILYDNAKTIVNTRDAYAQGHHRWHPGMLDLAKRYGFVARLCRPY